MKLSDLRKLSANMALQQTPPDPQLLAQELTILGYDPSNLYQELEMESRFVDTHRDTSYSNANVGLHSHTFCELLYCRNSCGAEYLVGTERYRLKKGDIIMIAPGVSHRPLLPEHMAEPYRRDVLWISVEFIEHLKRVFPYPVDTSGFNALLRTAGTRWEYLSDLFHNGVREAEERAPGWEMAVSGNTVTILTHLMRACMDWNTQPLKAEKPELVDQVMTYIEDNLSEIITLSNAARHFFVSDSTISHLFKQKMGVSFYRYVTQRRLIAAKTLITQGLTMDEVGRRSGFADYSTFYRAFKQEYGVSPRHYRSMMNQHSKNLPEL